MIGPIRKALVAFVLPAVAFALEQLGVALPDTWEDAVLAAIIPILVWAIPNEMKKGGAS
jgi:hypothetical protein